MRFDALPETAAWHHREARSGFEVVYFRTDGDKVEVRGCTTGVEDGQSWIVDYVIELDRSWHTRSAQVTARSESGSQITMLEVDEAGRWSVDGHPAPQLDDCFDLDLESSTLTNAFPVHRLGLAVGDHASAPAAFVRVPSLRVERLEQTYRRVEDEGSHQRFDYAAPVFDLACRLVYDDFGLLLTYPGLAVRAL